MGGELVQIKFVLYFTGICNFRALRRAHHQDYEGVQLLLFDAGLNRSRNPHVSWVTRSYVVVVVVRKGQ